MNTRPKIHHWMIQEQLGQRENGLNQRENMLNTKRKSEPDNHKGH